MVYLKSAAKPLTNELQMKTLAQFSKKELYIHAQRSGELWALKFRPVQVIFKILQVLLKSIHLFLIFKKVGAPET